MKSTELERQIRFSSCPNYENQGPYMANKMTPVANATAPTVRTRAPSRTFCRCSLGLALKKSSGSQNRTVKSFMTRRTRSRGAVCQHHPSRSWHSMVHHDGRATRLPSGPSGVKVPGAERVPLRPLRAGPTLHEGNQICLLMQPFVGPVDRNGQITSPG